MAKFGIISPQDWGLPVCNEEVERSIVPPGVTTGELARRIKYNLQEWLPRQIDPENKAFYGFYRATDGYREPPQTVNLIAPWLLIAAYDRYGEPSWLELARQALEFYYQKFVVSHPMSVVRGGARDGVAVNEIWTKFSAEFAIGALGYYRRTKQVEWLERGEQTVRYLLQAARHGFAAGYRLDSGTWIDTEAGWDSWGRAIEASLELEAVTGNSEWYELAQRWGTHALQIQERDGGFCLINRDYYNTDLAADELRGLFAMYKRSGEAQYLEAGTRFADWHLKHQRPDGAWSMTYDADGNLVVPTVGPGDVPNIAIALLYAHRLTGRAEYLQAALRAFGYSLSVQVLPSSDSIYADDENVRWGFWSWDPPYDYTVSCDQATHHIRGMMFLMDFVGERIKSSHESVSPA